MLVLKICLTGGPCGGKSSALDYIKSQLTKQVWDYKRKRIMVRLVLTVKIQKLMKNSSKKIRGISSNITNL